MEIEDPPNPVTEPSSTRWKPNRLCVITTAVFVFTVVLCYHCHGSHPPPPPPVNSTPSQSAGGQVHIVLDEHTYNVSVTSNHDIIHSLDVQGTRVEIFPRDLLEYNTTGPARITRSDGTSYDPKLSSNPGQKLTPLEDIKPSMLNVFFIETRCGTSKARQRYTVDSGVVLNARQICAVESTAKMNPSRPVYLLHTCPLDDHFYTKSPIFVQALMDNYPNVHIVYLDMAEFFLRTNVEELYFGGRFEESIHPIEHVSDVVRLLTLWKFGGTYMDIDVVSIRPLDGLGSNYAGWQDDHTVATGVLNFAPSGLGHQILTECLDDLRFNFEPNSWSTNGPILVTNTLMRLCDVNNRQNKKCSEFTAYPVPVFYPIYYTEWQQFFDHDERSVKRTLNQLNDTYVVHIWNKMSSQGVVQVGSSQAYGLLAAQYCPAAYTHCGPTF